MWRIPEYVRDANDDPDYMIKLSEKMRKTDKPPFSVNFRIFKLDQIFVLKFETNNCLVNPDR